jgi:adhesin/invasin
MDDEDDTALTQTTQKTITIVDWTNAATLAVATQTGLLSSGTASSTGTADQTITAATSVTDFYFTVATGTATRYAKVSVSKDDPTDAIGVTESVLYYATGAEKTRTFKVSVTTPAVGDSFTVTAANEEDNLTYTVTYAASTPVITLDPAAGFTLKTGSSIEVVATVKDNLGAVLANQPVTVTVAGRNAGTGASTLTTNADGKVTYTLADKSTSATALTDTVTFTAVNAAAKSGTASVAFTWSTTGVVVSSMTFVVADSTLDIDTAQTGGVPASGSATAITFVAKDANGARVGAGALVTVTAPTGTLVGTSTTISTMGTSKSKPTDSLGEVVFYFYSQKTGIYTVSASAGTATATTTAITVTSPAANRRSVNLVADQPSVEPTGIVRFIATVTDRYGNPVSGAAVAFTETGVGRFLTGSALSPNTDANGQAFIDLSSTALETGNAAVTATITGGQSADLAGTVNGAVVAGVAAGKATATATASFAASAAEAVAPTLSFAKENGRIILTGTCSADEGDVIIYVKRPGKAWNEKAKTLECFAGEFDGDIKAAKRTVLYRVKQEGTGMFSNSVLVRK